MKNLGEIFLYIQTLLHILICSKKKQFYRQYVKRKEYFITDFNEHLICCQKIVNFSSQFARVLDKNLDLNRFVNPFLLGLQILSEPIQTEFEAKIWGKFQIGNFPGNKKAYIWLFHLPPYKCKIILSVAVFKVEQIDFNHAE